MTTYQDIVNAEYLCGNFATRYSTPLGLKGVSSCLLAYGDGFHDDEVGTVEYGPGHLFRYDKYVVLTTDTGATYGMRFDTELAAGAYMGLVHDVYALIDLYDEEEH